MTKFSRNEIAEYQILAKSTKEIRENLKPAVLKGYVSNTLGGHWVTIDGNHVLIKD